VQLWEQLKSDQGSCQCPQARKDLGWRWDPQVLGSEGEEEAGEACV